MAAPAANSAPSRRRQRLQLLVVALVFTFALSQRARK